MISIPHQFSVNRVLSASWQSTAIGSAPARCCTRTVRFSRIALDREANHGHAPPAVSKPSGARTLSAHTPSRTGYRRRSNSMDFAVLTGGQHTNESSSDDAALAATADRIHPTRCQHRTTSTTGTSCPTPDLTVGTWLGHGTRQRRRRRDFWHPDGAAVCLPSTARDPELPQPFFFNHRRLIDTLSIRHQTEEDIPLDEPIRASRVQATMSSTSVPGGVQMPRTHATLLRSLVQ